VHHVDRVGVELAGDTRGGLSPGMGHAGW